jgi:pimeloyl-ACP methyl ester carboxylesterase
MAVAEMVRSADGTAIAFARLGHGPALILVDGALGGREHPLHSQLAALLSARFTVFNYNRRGRGDSGDTAPYAVAREIEDIAALIEAAGGSAFVYGISSGAILALDVANAHPDKVAKLALYEPPFIIDASRAPLPTDYVAHLDALNAAGRRGDAVEYFMTAALQIPAEFLDQMRRDPGWADMETVAHTVAYDGRVVGDTMSGKPLPTNRWSAVTMPTLVLDGEITENFIHTGAAALAAILPAAQRQTLAGQHHGVEPAALAPALIAFFAD